MERVARRERVASLTERGALTRQERSFMISEGLGPATSRPRSVNKHAEAAAARGFDLAHAVARFKRAGTLPGVTVQVVKDSTKTTQIDGRALARMIRAMLSRDVEQNPGPVAINYRAMWLPFLLAVFGGPSCQYPFYFAIIAGLALYFYRVHGGIGLDQLGLCLAYLEYAEIGWWCGSVSRFLLRILLLRAGVEANPGPPTRESPCASESKTLRRCETFSFGGVTRCSTCFTVVKNSKGKSTYFHPPTDKDAISVVSSLLAGAHCDIPPQIPRWFADALAAGLITLPEVTGAPCDRKGKEREEMVDVSIASPCAEGTSASEGTSAGETEPSPQGSDEDELAACAAHASPDPPTPKPNTPFSSDGDSQKSVVGNATTADCSVSECSVAQTRPSPGPILRGHTLSCFDMEDVMTRVSGHPVEIADISFDSRVVAYTIDKRLVIHRGVKEVQQAFEACQLTYVSRGEPYLSLGAVFTLVLSFVSGSIFGLSLFLSRNRMPARHGEHLPFITFALSLPLCIVLAGIAIFLPRRYTPDCVYKVPYVPHVVSSVVADYSRGTNAEAVRSTVRMKISRLAALPIPDFDAVSFINGSETVAEVLLEREDFFWEGAACFKQPQ